MRKITIVPAVALSLMTLGMVAAATPASAHPAVHVAGEDNGDTTDDTTVRSGGGSGTPSGGAATGAGGTAVEDTNSAPWVASGITGIALLGVGAATLRRRTVKA